MEQLITHIENISINITIPEYQEYNAFTNNDRRLTHTVKHESAVRKIYFIRNTKTVFQKTFVISKKKSCGESF